MNKLVFLPATAFLLFAGCSRPSVSTLPYDQMSDGDYVAVVNSIGYTKGELERDIAITEKLLALAGLPPDEMVSRKEPKTFRRSVVNGFVAREILLNEAKRRHIELSPADMTDFQEKFADGISGRMPLNFNALLDSLGKDATVFRNNLKKDALSAKTEDILKGRIAAEIPDPSPAELAQMRAATRKNNRQVESDNAALFRLATNAWKSIRAGNDFAVVGKKLPSLHKGIAFEADLQDASGRFASAANGTLTPPTAANGGLEVVKVAVAADGNRRISRLFFKPETAKPMPTDETLRKTEKSKAINAQYAKLLKELKKAAKISTASL